MASGGSRPANVPVLVHGVPMQNLQQLPSSQHIQRAQQQMAQLAAQQQQQQQQQQRQAQAAQAQPIVHHQFMGRSSAPQSKYADLLVVIEDMGRDIRPTYAGSRMATERLKRGIVHAKSLVRECLAETERSARN